ncbi:MAG: hypothetical protein WCG20_03740 [bacterium]
MPEFSLELHKKLETGKHDSHGLNVLQNLRERAQQPSNLFTEQEEKQLEDLKLLYPEEFKLLENSDAYQELSETEKKEVQNKMQDDHFRKFMKDRFGKEVE